jgi:uncharacterized protein (TIGR02598 family)
MTIPSASLPGTSLTETTLALGVASVCLVTLLGLLPIGFQTEHHAIQETLAVDILTAVAADLRSTQTAAEPNETITSPHFNITIPPTPVTEPITSTLFFTDDGVSDSPSSRSRCRLTIQFVVNTNIRYVTMVHLKMTWPADALPENATGGAELFLALDRK